MVLNTTQEFLDGRRPSLDDIKTVALTLARIFRPKLNREDLSRNTGQ